MHDYGVIMPAIAAAREIQLKQTSKKYVYFWFVQKKGADYYRPLKKHSETGKPDELKKKQEWKNLLLPFYFFYT